MSVGYVYRLANYRVENLDNHRLRICCVRRLGLCGSLMLISIPLSASPTIFQIPEASDDPITRSIAFFALCRALAGIILGPIFLIYFRRSQASSVHSAILWCQVSTY
jgi:hypothetical protein